MTSSNISILADSHAEAMAATHGGEVSHYRKAFYRLVNIFGVEKASEALTCAATELEHYALVPPPKDDRWTQSIGDQGEAAWLRDRAEYINDQRYDNDTIEAPLEDTDAQTRQATALERIANNQETANLIAAFHAFLEPGSEYDIPTEPGTALDTQGVAEVIARRLEPLLN